MVYLLLDQLIFIVASLIFDGYLYFFFQFGIFHDSVGFAKMKLDTSGFETSMPMIGFGSSSDMLDELSSVPSFDLPRTKEVTFFVFVCDSKQCE